MASWVTPITRSHSSSCTSRWRCQLNQAELIWRQQRDESGPPSDSFSPRSYWIPGSSASTWPTHLRSLSGPLKQRGLQGEIVPKIGRYNLVKSTTLASKKSLCQQRGVRSTLHNCSVARTINPSAREHRSFVPTLHENMMA